MLKAKTRAKTVRAFGVPSGVVRKFHEAKVVRPFATTANSSGKGMQLLQAAEDATQ